MIRVLSGAVLVAITVALVWFASQRVFAGAALIVALIASQELIDLARASGLVVPAFLSRLAAVLPLAVLTLPGAPADALAIALMTAFVALAFVMVGAWSGGPGALANTAAAMLPSIYIGLPIGAIVATRARGGPAALFLLMLTVMVSDTAQYYTGRATGRHPLAPAISPSKTVEGAIGGFIFGPLTMAVAGAWWQPTIGLGLRIALGVAVVALGIAGDLFESMLKRSAGVKDSSTLIPGHGGMLDRIDSLLFAAPVYYVVITYV